VMERRERDCERLLDLSDFSIGWRLGLCSFMGGICTFEVSVGDVQRRSSILIHIIIATRKAGCYI
jgi:hypothetical protein